MKKIILLVSVLVLFNASCKKASDQNQDVNAKVDFNPNSLQTVNYEVPKIKGQLLYVPVYSNLPYNAEIDGFNLQGFATIHNTDLFNTIQVTKVVFFNQSGKPIYDFLTDKTYHLKPLETIYYHIPYEDKSGLGANFLIEWVSTVKVTEPLVESVSISLYANHSLAIPSKGKIIREMR